LYAEWLNKGGVDMVFEWEESDEEKEETEEEPEEF
jgi:hypothetical protein